MYDSQTTSLRFKLLVAATIVAAIFYVCWNLYWIFRCEVPPSILIGVFGIPAPTTGMTRSTIALIHGNLIASLQLNPFTIPTILIYLKSIYELFKKVILRKNVILTSFIINSWIILLFSAWIYKLITFVIY